MELSDVAPRLLKFLHRSLSFIALAIFFFLAGLGNHLSLNFVLPLLEHGCLRLPLAFQQFLLLLSITDNVTARVLNVAIQFRVGRLVFDFDLLYPCLLLSLQLVQLFNLLVGFKRLLGQLSLLLNQLELRLLQASNLRIHRRLHLLIDYLFLPNCSDVLSKNAVSVGV